MLSVGGPIRRRCDAPGRTRLRYEAHVINHDGTDAPQITPQDYTPHPLGYHLRPPAVNNAAPCMYPTPHFPSSASLTGGPPSDAVTTPSSRQRAHGLRTHWQSRPGADALAALSTWYQSLSPAAAAAGAAVAPARIPALFLLPRRLSNCVQAAVTRRPTCHRTTDSCRPCGARTPRHR